MKEQVRRKMVQSILVTSAVYNSYRTTEFRGSGAVGFVQDTENVFFSLQKNPKTVFQLPKLCLCCGCSSALIPHLRRITRLLFSAQIV